MEQESGEHNEPSEELQTTPVATPSRPQHVYSKDFLISFAELEQCNRVPIDLDAFFRRDSQPMMEEKGVAIPGEAPSRGLIRAVRENDFCCESPPDVPEWRRPSSLPGSPFLKSGPRHGELRVSSPRPGPAQLNNNLTRSIMSRSGSAKWELHTSMDERDRDGIRSPFEWESSAATESGGRCHNKVLARSFSLVPFERDGLLGGGPKESKNMPQVHVNDRHRSERASRIGRLAEQSHSSRGGKLSRNHSATQNLVQEDADSVSHETFGSDDRPSGERSEQERQRRDQFEQQRKESRKKPLNIARNHNDTWLGEGLHGTECFSPSSPGTPQSTSSKDDTLRSLNKHLGTSLTSRPLFPPGFSNHILANVSSPKGNHEADKQHENDDDVVPFKLESSTDGAELDYDDHLSSWPMKFNYLEDENQTIFSPSQPPMTSKVASCFPSHGSDHKDHQSHSGPSSTANKSEDPDLSSDFSSAKPVLTESSENLLFSKLSSVTGSVLPMPAGPSLEDVEKLMTAGADSGSDLISEFEGSQMNQTTSNALNILSVKPPSMVNDTIIFPQTLDGDAGVAKDVTQKKNPPVFLKCEDLEQSLLSQSVHTENQTTAEDVQQDIGNSVDLMRQLQAGSSEKGCQEINHGRVAAEEQLDLEGNGSVHLMSLLQKSTGKTDSMEGLGPNNNISWQVSEQLAMQDDRVEEKYDDTAKKNNLGIVFGQNFLNALQAVAEPVSAKQGMDNWTHVEKDNGSLSSTFFNNSQPRRAGHANVAFHEEAGWKHNGHVMRELQGPESTPGSSFQYLQDNLLAEMHVNHPPSMKSAKNSPSSRGVSVNGSSFGDLRNRNLLHHPYRANGQPHDFHRYSAPEVLSHRLHGKPMPQPHLIHNSPIHSMGMYASNSVMYPEFPGASNSYVADRFEEGSPGFRGAQRVPSTVSAGYPDSIQMGFNTSQGMPDLRMTGTRIRPFADSWFRGEHPPQGGFRPYQHLMIHEGKSVPVMSGLGITPGGQSYNIGLPSDSLGQPDIPYNQYKISRNRPGFG